MLDQMLNAVSMLVSEIALPHIACNLVMSNEKNHAQDVVTQLLQGLYAMSPPKGKQA